MSTPRWPLGIPSRLRPIGVIGAGATSVVWQVRDIERGDDLAVKVVTIPSTAGSDRGQRVETEARALARLRGLGGVVALREVGLTEQGEAWLAHDLVQGSTLAERAPLTGAQVASVGAALAATLAEAHLREVCHGDVTPTNIVFDLDGTPLLADFGMAGLGRDSNDPGGLTPAFAAPERLRGAVPSPASDIYGLGATLRSITGSPHLPEVDLVLVRCCADAPSARPDPGALARQLAALSSHRGPRSR